MVSRLLSSEKGRYLVIGGSVYLLELLIIVIAEALGASPVKAVGVAFIIGTAVSFLLQKFVTFQDKRTHHKVLLSQVAAIGALILWNFLFSLLMTRLLQDYMPAVIVRTLVIAITMVWNFYLYKTRIFKSSLPPLG